MRDPGRPPYTQPGFVPDNSEGLAPPAGWSYSHIRAWFSNWIGTLSAGQPEPMSPHDARRGPAIFQPPPFGAWRFRITRRYDRGADAFALQGGALSFDPIGAGVPFTKALPVMQPAALKIPFGDAIFWTPQTINYGTQPSPGGPIYTPAQVAALAGNPSLAGNTLYNAPYIAPPFQGFGG